MPQRGKPNIQTFRRREEKRPKRNGACSFRHWNACSKYAHGYPAQRANGRCADRRTATFRRLYRYSLHRWKPRIVASGTIRLRNAPLRRRGRLRPILRRNGKSEKENRAGTTRCDQAPKPARAEAIRLGRPISDEIRCVPAHSSSSGPKPRPQLRTARREHRPACCAIPRPADRKTDRLARNRDPSGPKAPSLRAYRSKIPRHAKAARSGRKAGEPARHRASTASTVLCVCKRARRCSRSMTSMRLDHIQKSGRLVEQDDRDTAERAPWRSSPSGAPRRTARPRSYPALACSCRRPAIASVRRPAGPAASRRPKKPV